MADTSQDRTEPASPRRREEARERGQVARSTDFTSAVVILGAVVALYMCRESIVGRLVAMIRYCLEAGDAAAMQPDQMVSMLILAFADMAKVLVPLVLVVVVLALAVSFGQVGVLFTFHPITPTLDKLNPINGLRRMFSGRSFVHMVLSIAKMLVLSAVAYFTLKGRGAALAHSYSLSCAALVEITMDLMFTLGLRLAVALLILAIIDLMYQRWKMEKDLRMTKQEVREELKRMDGDPHIRHRRREMQRQLAMQRIRGAVPKADVVVTNPTHYAVVIQYDSRTMNAPKVTAKGADHLVEVIRRLAIEHGVPIVERPPLARALYRSVEVGQEIPAQFYRAVAEILAYVYELAGRGFRRRPLMGVAS